jgi:biopolymer transport protein ExbD
MSDDLFANVRRSGPVPSLTSLIDVVFLLLLFFMLSSTLVKPDPFDIRLPESQGGLDQLTQPSVVLIGADGRLAVNDSLVGDAQLADALRLELAQTARPELLIKADAAATTGQVIAVLGRARAAGYSQITLATQYSPR